jgi:hypothetical protein
MLQTLNHKLPLAVAKGTRRSPGSQSYTPAFSIQATYLIFAKTTPQV